MGKIIFSSYYTCLKVSYLQGESGSESEGDESGSEESGSEKGEKGDKSEKNIASEDDEEEQEWAR